MSIVLVGLNHKTAPVEIRERLAIAEAEVPRALRKLVDGERAAEGLMISTCNRVEVVTVTQGELPQAMEYVKEFLYHYHHLPASSFDGYLYHYIDHDAIRHLFRVAAGLDSMVIGEPQIFGQVKDAYSRALEAGTVGKVLTRLMQRAFTIAKRVRTETAIGASAVSVSSAAVELAKKIFDELEGKVVLLIGAGEMAELAVKHLVSDGANRVIICNRTLERAVELASRFHAEAISLDELTTNVARADIIIGSAGGAEYVVRSEHITPAMGARRNRPLFLIDISVPRTLDPAINNLDNVFLYNIDDLKQVVMANLEHRQQEAARAEVLIDEAVNEFVVSLKSLEVGPLIAAFRERLTEIAYGELERHRHRLGHLTPDQEKVIKHMLDGIVNRFAHPAITKFHQAARSDSESPENLNIVNIWSEAFELKEKNEVKRET